MQPKHAKYLKRGFFAFCSAMLLIVGLGFYMTYDDDWAYRLLEVVFLLLVGAILIGILVVVCKPVMNRPMTYACALLSLLLVAGGVWILTVVSYYTANYFNIPLPDDKIWVQVFSAIVAISGGGKLLLGIIVWGKDFDIRREITTEQQSSSFQTSPRAQVTSLRR